MGEMFPHHQRSRLGKFGKYICSCWQIEGSKTVGGVCERALRPGCPGDVYAAVRAGPIAAPVSHRGCDWAHLAQAQSELATPSTAGLSQEASGACGAV